jgi:hypothetical protein
MTVNQAICCFLECVAPDCTLAGQLTDAVDNSHTCQTTRQANGEAQPGLTTFTSYSDADASHQGCLEGCSVELHRAPQRSSGSLNLLASKHSYTLSDWYCELFICFEWMDRVM